MDYKQFLSTFFSNQNLEILEIENFIKEIIWHKNLKFFFNIASVIIKELIVSFFLVLAQTEVSCIFGFG